MDPASPWLTFGGSLFGGGLGGSPTAGPSSADAVFSTNMQFDNSGWNVAFGDSSIDAAVKKTSEQGSDMQGSSSASTVSQYLPYLVLIIGAAIAYKALKK